MPLNSIFRTPLFYKTLLTILIAYFSPCFAAELNFGDAHITAIQAGQMGNLSSVANLTGTINPQLRYQLSFNNLTVSALNNNHRMINGIALMQGEVLGAVANNLQLATNNGTLQPLEVSGNCQWDASVQAIVIHSSGNCQAVYLGSVLSRLQTETGPHLNLSVYAKQLVNSTEVETNLSYQFSTLLQ